MKRKNRTTPLHMTGIFHYKLMYHLKGEEYVHFTRGNQFNDNNISLVKSMFYSV